MNPLAYRQFYRRHLPHIQPAGATLFVTFRLSGSIPRSVVREYQEQARRLEKRVQSIPDIQKRAHESSKSQSYLFGKWDEILDSATESPFWLRESAVAELVAESLVHRDGQVYDLIAFCIMPNHVHLVCMPLERNDETIHSLTAILHSLKLYTARRANVLLNRRGEFWQHENYDHYARNDQELERIVSYVIMNPVKAGFVKEWQEWEWTYCKYAP